MGKGNLKIDNVGSENLKLHCPKMLKKADFKGI